MRLQIIKENILCRTDYINFSGEWHYEGEELNYKENLKLGKLDPIYDSNTLVYKHNSVGYRTAEFDTFEENGFVLVFGCSYTEGIGLHEEHIWHSHITKNHNLKVMNLGIGGTGCDAIRLNSALYIANKLPKPRLVVFQWPGFYRRMFSYANDESGRALIATMPSTGAEHEVTSTAHVEAIKHQAMKLDEKWFLERYITYPDEMHNRVFQDILCSNMLFKTWNVPVVNFMWDEFNFKKEDCALNTYFKTGVLDIKIINTNTVRDLKARDCLHPGRHVQERAYELIKPKLDRYI